MPILSIQPSHGKSVTVSGRKVDFKVRANGMVPDAVS